MSGDLLTFGFALVKKESQVDANETRGKAMAGKLTKQEKSWVLYDVGNSAFVLLATALIPVYFSSIAEPGSSVVVAWGYAEPGELLAAGAVSLAQTVDELEDILTR